jgi:hypothetical protein
MLWGRRAMTATSRNARSAEKSVAGAVAGTGRGGVAKYNDKATNSNTPARGNQRDTRNWVILKKITVLRKEQRNTRIVIIYLTNA